MTLKRANLIAVQQLNSRQIDKFLIYCQIVIYWLMIKIIFIKHSI